MHTIVNIMHKGVGIRSRVWGQARPSATMLLYLAHQMSLSLWATKKFDKVHYYLYLTTNSPSYKY